ncbi:WD40-repeat-containing domain protein [Boletus reticuloceps]|uniref:WD40-repeat-containing domain protein n=1 Tax=Boletus reticuloceps TaxID=495285 RepID=A0A8I2YGA4_9AGAM|nr:WD40-repeat-containing domain protein [Boletus reticuloceps]
MTTTEYSQPFEIDVGGLLYAVTFSPHGEYIVSGDNHGVRVWRVDDGEEIATMSAGRTINCLAVSRNGKWIAAGTQSDKKLLLWNATTHERVLKHKHNSFLNAVDFSPDSTRLVSASGNTATIWDISNRQPIQTLDHQSWVFAAKYSPKGDRIATATQNLVRVWDTNNGRLLVNIQVKMIPLYNSGLVWFNNHLFVVSDDTIKQFDASTGSPVAEWQVPDSTSFSCISLPKHGQFIAYSNGDTVTFWCTSTRSQLAAVQHAQNINSIAFSLDDRFLAIGGEDGKISIKSLSRIIDSTPSSRPPPMLRAPDIQVDDAASNSPIPSFSLREWAKAKLTRNSWKDVLLSATGASIHLLLSLLFWD